MKLSMDAHARRTLTHLERLEAESIHIMREVVSEAEKPVMLYSVGKDSAVMLHLAKKAFYPSRPPFPLLHVDTTWKFRDMYALRDKAARDAGMELLVYHNPEAMAKGINPFDHGSLHTDMWKTEGLKQALNLHGFDVAFGGARRDEEKSRAKERIFSFRSANHRWDPKQQRPELWNLYNARKVKGESIRVFPISNWTELDIWQYIHLEGIEIVPLYFAAPRPTVKRDGLLLMVDDERFRFRPGEAPVMRSVRFRTLGYPVKALAEWVIVNASRLDAARADYAKRREREKLRSRRTSEIPVPTVAEAASTRMRQVDLRKVVARPAKADRRA
jgi:sulfate adenylyltransferase subunit 2